MNNVFEIIAPCVGVLWVLSIVLVYLYNNKLIAEMISFLGVLIVFIYIIALWIYLGRPPMRTIGETRLWYSLFLSIIGLVVYRKWHFKWFYSYSILFALLFLMLNYFKPETFNKSLMPALQSVWFVPHVIVYMVSYAFLGASALIGFKGLYDKYKGTYEASALILADDIVYIGFAFLNLGIIFGALWAKQAWGHYWTWDPKETWALITWLIYLFYIHFRLNFPQKINRHFLILSLAFIVLIVCWFGINYLPSAQNSVHIYS
jgi:ABC-type transport system involved in cytochrome c biogenesis permease subunit